MSSAEAAEPVVEQILETEPEIITPIETNANFESLGDRWAADYAARYDPRRSRFAQLLKRLLGDTVER